MFTDKYRVAKNSSGQIVSRWFKIDGEYWNISLLKYRGPILRNGMPCKLFSTVGGTCLYDTDNDVDEKFIKNIFEPRI